MARGRIVTNNEVDQVRNTGLSDDIIIRVARKLITDARKAKKNQPIESPKEMS